MDENFPKLCWALREHPVALMKSARPAERTVGSGWPDGPQDVYLGETRYFSATPCSLGSRGSSTLESAVAASER